ncbi:MAG: SpvB/TcaC N-terminal domain-containing protein, partial [Bacteroidales bacterium]
MKHKYYISKCIKLISLSLLLVCNVNKLEAQTPVGTLPGTIDVSPTGMATYSIPIEVVPGTQGMQPNLSIVYNSQGGNGLLGMKWDIAGLSAITRVTQTLYHDNNITDIQKNNDDRFVLDGNRLIAISGKNGVDGTLYGTEMETFLKIKSCGQLNGAPDHFKVIREDGSVIHYGEADNSRKYLDNIPSIWMINKIIDLDGNYVRFTYDYIDSLTWIKKIEYTGNNSTGLSPYAKVTFTYQADEATKDIKLYCGGNSYKKTRLLQKITVSYNNSIVREYTFTYTQNNKYARLTQITVSDENNVSLNPTTISWENDGPEITTVKISDSPRTSLIGDFNGDGIQDIIYYNLSGPDTSRPYSVYIKDINGYPTLYKSDSIDGFISSSYALDIDGDLSDEFVFRAKSRLYYLDINSADLTQHEYLFSYLSISEFPGDYNGDGKADIIITQSINSAFVKAYLYLNPNAWPNETPLITSKNSDWYVCDFNGNGKTDIQITYEGGLINSTTIVFEYKKLNDGSYGFDDIFTGGFPGEYHKCYYGDFNGDGIHDILSYSYGGLWEIHLGTGKAYAWPAVELSTLDPLDEFDNPSYYIPIITDFDGDGKDDIIQIAYNYNTQKARIAVYFTRKINESEYSYDYKEVFMNWSHYPGHYQCEDVNNDGKMDLIYKGQYYLSFYKNGKDNLVKKITNGLGSETEIVYSYFILHKQSTSNNIPFPLVQYVKQSNGLNNLKNTTTYTYAYLQFSFSKRIVLGFLDYFINYNGINTFYDYRVNDYYQTMFLYGQTKYKNGAYTNDIEQVVNTVEFLPLGNKRFYIYNSISASVDYLNNNYKYIERQLYKNPSLKCRDSIVTVSYKSQQELSAPYDIKQVKQIEYSYQNTNNDFVGSILKISKIASKEYIAGSSLVKEEYTFYNYKQRGNTSRLDNITITKSDKFSGTRFVNYNNFGIPTLIENTSPFSSIEKIMDNTGRFVIKEISMNTDVTEYTYCPKTGNVLSVKDINNLTTYYEYDTWGRITKKTYPDGNFELTSYNWSNSYALRIANDKTVISVYNSDGTMYYIYLDKLGRELWKRSASSSYAETEYDTWGHVYRVSYAYDFFHNPYQQRYWTTYKYDYLGRLIEEHNYTKHFQYCYAPRSVTIRDLYRNISYIKTFDVISRLISSTDPEGTINYTYTLQNYNNQVCHKTQISAFGKTTTIITDLWGNRLSLTDPDAGTITSNYNNSGQLFKQTDANGNETTYNYDSYGRITQNFFGAQGSDIRCNYIVYDGDGKKGTLTSETQLYQGQLFFIAYKYDMLNRIIEKRYVQYEDTLRYKFTYGSNGRLDSIVYPFDFTIRHSYNLGRPSTISWYESGVLTPLYNVDDYLFDAPNVTTTFDIRNRLVYNDINQLESKFSTFVSNNDTLQKKGYVYETGRLIKRINGRIPNLVEPRAEIFDYDNMDRLTNVSQNTYFFNQLFSMNYDDNKISSHSNIGMYQYDQSHALKKVELNDASSISQQQCDIIYTPFNKVETITEGANNYKIEYYPNHQKGATSLWHNNTLIEHKLYAGKSFEWETVNDKKYYYVYAEGQPIAVFIQEGNNDPVPYLIITDHLGGVDLITDRYGNMVDSMSFDAWGNRRNYNNWHQKDNSVHLIDRGFTMHQHLDSFNLINMEGRMYDPVVAQFLSPDPYVQAPEYTQGLNRYSYCMNS